MGSKTDRVADFQAQMETKSYETFSFRLLESNISYIDYSMKLGLSSAQHATARPLPLLCNSWKGAGPGCQHN